MRITLLQTGKTDASWLKTGTGEYAGRLSHYIRFDVVDLIAPKNFKQLNPQQLKDAEGKLMLRQFSSADQVILLDEKGKTFSSEEFAGWIQKIMNAGTRHLMFVIGGAYGFSDEVYAAANARISMSSMTFSHQMVRLFFAEQLYRAFTILRNEPYHNP